MDIEVAPLRLKRKVAFKGSRESLEQSDAALKWEDRPRAVISVDEDTIFRHVREIGAEALGLQIKKGRDFLKQDLVFQSSHDRAQYEYISVVLDPDGAARWWFDGAVVTVRDALELADAGLLEADPHRYFILLDSDTAEGGNGLDIWFEIIRVLPYVQQWATAVADTVGPWAFIASTIGTFAAGVKKLGTRWSSNGSDITKYQQLFTIGRTTKQAATLLRAPEEDVGLILPFLGLELGRDGYWRAAKIPAQREVVELGRVINTAASLHMTPRQLASGLSQVLALPPAERDKKAESIFRKIKFDTLVNDESDSPYLAAADGRLDRFEVFDYTGDSGYDKPIGIIQDVGQGSYALLLPDGRKLLDREGKELRFSGIDDAASHMWACAKAARLS